MNIVNLKIVGSSAITIPSVVFSNEERVLFVMHPPLYMSTVGKLLMPIECRVNSMGYDSRSVDIITLRQGKTASPTKTEYIEN
jgi:hypothetical protein